MVYFRNQNTSVIGEKPLTICNAPEHFILFCGTSKAIRVRVFPITFVIAGKEKMQFHYLIVGVLSIVMKKQENFLKGAGCKP